MKAVGRACVLLAALLIVGQGSFLAASAGAEGKEGLTWRNDQTADAHLEGWPFAKVLSRLSAATGWKIYVEPGIEDPVSVRFSKAAHGEALRYLLGKSSYALIPERNGGSKLYVYRSGLRQATTFVQPDPSDRPVNWIANELILSLAPGSKVDVNKLAAELGAKVSGKSDALNAYRLEFPDAAAAEAAREKLSARDDLAFHDNYSFERPTMTASGSPSPSTLFPLDPSPVARGEQLTVALVDTAIQPLEGKMKDFVLPSVHIRDQPPSLPDEPTHATSMAQTLLNSMAFGSEGGSGGEALGKVRVLPIDIYGSAATTTTFEVAQGLYQAIQSGAQVINLSLGGTGQSPMVDYLLEMANRKEIMVFASAGNSPTTEPTWPAANPNTIAVTAADWQGNIAPYANRGEFVDVKAPGTSRVRYNGQNYISTGTSTATAFVSGQAAGLAALGFSAKESREAILKNFSVNPQPAPNTRP